MVSKVVIPSTRIPNKSYEMAEMTFEIMDPIKNT